MDSIRNLLGREAVILVVDDEPVLCDLVTDALKSVGIAFEVVHEGLTALARLRARDFDLVISDVKMPGLTGLELMGHARALGLPVPFVLVTGLQSNSVPIEAVRLGAVEFLEKPFSDEEIIETVVRALHISAREQTIEKMIAGIEPMAPLVDALRRQISMLRSKPPRR